MECQLPITRLSITNSLRADGVGVVLQARIRAARELSAPDCALSAAGRPPPRPRATQHLRRLIRHIPPGCNEEPMAWWKRSAQTATDGTGTGDLPLIRLQGITRIFEGD